MDETLFERWLYESESDSLDFKRDQYRFNNASDDEKSKLVKDIISMINSWRRVDGYIVIGIEDKAEKPNILHGISEHIDDASIQQLVNSKISGICEFEYRTYTKEDKTFGIIRIPTQKRPVFLSKNYGKLKKDTVYVRRGSSTDIAKPDEISKMGTDQLNSKGTTDLKIGFFDKSKGLIIGNDKNVETTYYHIIDRIPDYSEYNEGILPHSNFNSMVRNDYYRDVVEYINFDSSFVPISFAIHNRGDKEAVNIQVEIVILSNNVRILLDGDEVKIPSKDLFSTIGPIHSRKYYSAYSVERQDERWLIRNELKCLHAKRVLELEGIIYIQVRESANIKVKTRIYFDGQAVPCEQEFNLNIKHHCQELTWYEFSERISEYLSNYMK